MWKKKFVYVLNYLKTFKAVHKNNPQTHSPQQNITAVLTTAAYFKVFFKVSEKVNSAIEFCIFKLHIQILHIHILQFQLKLTILIFWTKFAQKECVSGLRKKKWTAPLNSAYSN